eukprot:CAMPEP_0179158762 /NCGR_PEP_ID=MMETSP0796-20121207/77475_1 /TAXON_ID=73915 /ORGANISM="Pyrodinium bahamense, Strain pbaha01" /LENGTH=66 /DNA_ID=CAMNT_0020860439 /DNA_START=13 /DNA_END=210 /DNA_ORIENTATION=-
MALRRSLAALTPTEGGGFGASDRARCQRVSWRAPPKSRGAAPPPAVMEGTWWIETPELGGREPRGI